MLPVAILAGGLATRLRPITETIPKALIDVGGRPFAAHQLDWLQTQGVSEVTFLVGHYGEMVERTIGDGSAWGLQISYVYDGERLLGTGGAIRRALPALGPAFFVMYGDSYLQCDLAEIQRTFESSGRAALMTVFRNENRWDRSNVELVAGDIAHYDKREPTAAMHHIDYGLGIMTARALERYPSDEKFDLADVYRDLLREGQLAAAEVPDRFYEIGSPEGLAETRALFEQRP